MRTLAKDWEEFQNWAPENRGVNKLQLSGVVIEFEKIKDGFIIKIMTPVGTWSEQVNDYKDFYEAIGRIFAEKEGLIENMFDK